MLLEYVAILGVLVFTMLVASLAFYNYQERPFTYVDENGETLNCVTGFGPWGRPVVYYFQRLVTVISLPVP